MNWLYNKGKKDKSVEKTAYIAWDESTFIAKCVLRNTAYTGYNMTYPSDLINDSFSLVDDDNVDVFKKTLGTAGETGDGMYSALDMMSLIYRLKSPEREVCFT